MPGVTKHTYEPVSAYDTENPGVDDANQKYSKRAIQKQRCLALLALSLILSGAFFYVMDRFSDPDYHSGVVEPGFPGGRPHPKPGYQPMSHVTVDEKLRHQVPFLAEESGSSIIEAKASNAAFFTDILQDIKGRYVTHIILDKPVYKPGEVVRASCFLVNPFDKSLRSSIGGPYIYAAASIKDPKDANVESLNMEGAPDGVGFIQWTIPKNAAGGDYKLVVEPSAYPHMITGAERTFEVRATRASNAKINKKLEFANDGYGAGETVQVSLKVAGEDTTAMFSATIDGVVVAESEFQSVNDGTAKFSFTLPKKMERGEGTVTAKVSRGALLESVSKTVPIILQHLDLGVFPEGGVLVAGLKQRIYAEALHSLTGKPTDFRAEVFSDRDPKAPLGSVESLHEGRGVSNLFLVPREAKRVFLKLTHPESVAGQEVEMPMRAWGKADPKHMVGLSIERDVFKHAFSARISSERPLKLVVSRLEKVLTETTIQPSVGGSSNVAVASILAQVSLKDDTDNYGVLRVTVVDPETELPLAERLVFRLPPRVLEVQLSAAVVDDVSEALAADDIKFESVSTLRASPADGIAVQVSTFARELDEKTGEPRGPRVPVPAVLALRVSDSALAATMEGRLLPPRLQEAIWLETEVDRLNDAGQYLPGSAWAWLGTKDDAPSERGTSLQRLGLLLGTQGWRTFAYYDVKGFSNSGRTPLSRDQLVPTGFSPKKIEEPLWGPSPVSKFALDRLLCIKPRIRPITMAKTAFAPNVKARPLMHAARGQAQPMMMMAAAFDAPENDNAQMRMREAAPPNELAEMGDAIEEEAVAQGEMIVEGGAGVAEEEGMAEEDNAGDMAMDIMADQDIDDTPVAAKVSRPGYERVYAHPQRKYTKKEFEEGAKRSDFTETVYHNPSLVTKCDKNNACTARFTFGLSESSTARFVVHADGLGKDEGSLIGGGVMAIDTAVPLEIDFSLPTSLVSGDKAVIPVTLQNRLGDSVTISSKIAPLPAVVHTKTPTLDVAAVTSARIYAELLADRPVRGAGREFNLTLSVKANKGNAKDAVTRVGVMTAKGFPASQFNAGTLNGKGEAKFDLALPNDYVDGTLQPKVRAYTSPVGRLTKALEELVREPCGCFEQTSSTTYPLVFVLQYLKTHTGSNPTLIKKAEEMLTRGYAKLASYESPGGGFEWFGAAPGHEALTAYGLLQFAAMAHPTVGIAVDKAMIERTKKWMDSRRDGKGGFLRNERALDSFGAAPELTTNAYITWALVRAGLLRSSKHDREVEALITRALDEKERDPYIIALAALSLYDATSPSALDLTQARKLADRLAQMQDEKDGSLRRGAEDTITRSRGDALEIEATALGALVWLHESAAFASNARFAVDFLASKCKNGRFSSTQATALSLMAIVEFDRAFSKPLPPGRVELLVDGKLVESLRLGKPQASSSPRNKRTDYSAVFDALGRSAEECSGGSSWNTCGTACPLTCENPQPRPCTKQCVPSCVCPSDKPLFSSASSSCVETCDNTQDGEGGQATKSSPAVSDVDEEGVLNFSSEKLIKALGDDVDSKSISIRLVLAAESSVSQDEVEKIALPFSMAFKYAVVQPERKAKSDPVLGLEVKLETSTTSSSSSSSSGGSVKEGDVVTLRATVRNLAKNDKTGEAEALPLVVAVVGIPGGFEPRTDQLRELKDSKVVDFVETKPGQVILYWRALKPEAIVQVPIQCVAAIPGTFESPASRVYRYYADEDKVWTGGVKVRIEPQRAGAGKVLFW